MQDRPQEVVDAAFQMLRIGRPSTDRSGITTAQWRSVAQADASSEQRTSGQTLTAPIVGRLSAPCRAVGPTALPHRMLPAIMEASLRAPLQLAGPPMRAEASATALGAA